MTLQTNLGFTSKELLSFKSKKDVPKDFSGSCIISKSILHYYKDGLLHREDGPAAEHPNGDKYWYIHGKYHREDGPAIEYANCIKYWYVNSQLHREDGPAIEFKNNKEWWFRDKRHRTDGPAIEKYNSKSWLINNEYHRTDGPAIEYTNGQKEWYLNNKRYGINNDFTTESWKYFQRTIIF